MTQLKRLFELNSGQVAVIESLNHKDPHLLARLFDYGFFPGESIQLELPYQPLTGALTVIIQQNSFGLGMIEAAEIMVRPIC